MMRGAEQRAAEEERCSRLERQTKRHCVWRAGRVEDSGEGRSEAGPLDTAVILETINNYPSPRDAAIKKTGWVCLEQT